MTEIWLALIVALSSLSTLLIQGWQRRAEKRDTDGRLSQIHTLVNSNMTASMQAELSSTRRELVLMKRTIARDERENIVVTVEDRGAVKRAEERIAKLVTELEDRAKAS